MAKRRSGTYLESFLGHLEDRVDYLPHANPHRRGVEFDPHQRDAMRGIVSAIEATRRRLCLIESCGSGKTYVEIAALMASQAAKAELGINGDRKDLLVTAGRGPVSGVTSQFRNLGIEAGMFRGGERNLEPPVIIANAHALLYHQNVSRDLNDLIPTRNIDLVVVDEADLFLTPARQRLLEVLDPRTAVGLTATDEWPDGRNITDFFGGVVHSMRLVDGIERRINALPEILLYESEIPKESIRIRRGDYDPAILAAGWKNAEIHKAIPEVYRQIVGDDDKREWPTLVNVPSINMVRATTETLQRNFRDIAVVGWNGQDTTTPEMNRDMEAFKEGDIQIIVFCEMGGRGMNLENACLMIDGYPTMSLNKLEQRHGRALRRIRPGSELWRKGWRKTEAIIAQIIPRANRFRPALFTDLIEGYAELRRLQEDRESRGGGAPGVDLIDRVRRRIERSNPIHNLSLVADIDALEHIQRRDQLPEADPSGFYRIPRRYVRRDDRNR